MAFLTEAECRKAARDGGYGEPNMGAKQSTAGYRVHGLHGMKTPGLAGSYWTKAEAMRAARGAAGGERRRRVDYHLDTGQSAVDNGSTSRRE